MKKILNFSAIIALCLTFSACEKASSDIVSSSAASSSSGSGSSTGGSSGGGTSSGGSGGGTVLASGFTANFSIDVNDIYNVFENNTVKLSSKGSNIISYFWRFGDGRKSVEANPIITYPMHGYYTISLTVTAADGKTETMTKDLGILCNFYGGSGNH